MGLAVLRRSDVAELSPLFKTADSAAETGGSFVSFFGAVLSPPNNIGESTLGSSGSVLITTSILNIELANSPESAAVVV